MGDRAVWDSVLDLYVGETNAQEKSVFCERVTHCIHSYEYIIILLSFKKLLSCLSSIADESVLADFIVLAMNESIVRYNKNCVRCAGSNRLRLTKHRSQDYFTALELMANNRLGEQLIWDFVR